MSEISDLHKRIDALEKAREDIDARLSNIEGGLHLTDERIAIATYQIDKLSTIVRKTRRTLKRLNIGR